MSESVPSGSAVGDSVEAALAGMRSALRTEFGHAVLDVDVGIDPGRRVVSLSGMVASARAAARVTATASAAAPEWNVDPRRLAEIRTDDWRTLPPGVTVLSGSPVACTLTSELVGRDGPVEVLARVAASTFVRTSRGTLGWIGRPLGPRTEGPATIRPRFQASLTSVAAGWLGTPYRLGGTLPTGIDCSGLMLRCVAAAWGVRLPRHSTDQVPADLVSHHGPVRTGDAVILRDPAGVSHVALVVAQPRTGPVVVHASTTQGRVVVEPLDRLAASFVDVGFVALAALLEVHTDPV